MNRTTTILATLALMLAPAAACGQAGPRPERPWQAEPPPDGYELMDPHMLLTSMPPATSADSARARTRIRQLHEALEPYRDYEAALRDGYRPFLENLPQPELHVTHYGYARRAVLGEFDPTKPTSLLYERHGGEYELVGVMYTAGAHAGLEELDERVPLGLAQWHMHVNICLPPRGTARTAADWRGPEARFGPGGSIATEEECDEAGGRFLPRLFGWMVHVYPYEEELGRVFQHPAGHRDGDAHGHGHGMMDHGQH